MVEATTFDSGSESSEMRQLLAAAETLRNSALTPSQIDYLIKHGKLPNDTDSYDAYESKEECLRSMDLLSKMNPDRAKSAVNLAMYMKDDAPQTFSGMSGMEELFGSEKIDDLRRIAEEATGEQNALIESGKVRYSSRGEVFADAENIYLKKFKELFRGVPGWNVDRSAEGARTYF